MMYSWHGGNTYAVNYDAHVLQNSGLISAINFYVHSATNYGQIFATNYNCRYMTNYGVVKLTGNNINFGEFKLMEEGTLYIGDLVIHGGVLDPALADFLMENGLKVKQNDTDITFRGELNFDLKLAKQKLPHLFGKYESAPKKTFFDTRAMVKSDSKTTGQPKYWFSEPINDKHDLTKSIDEVFTANLLRKIADCKLSPKMKIDVFNKATVTRNIEDVTCHADDKTGSIKHHDLSTYVAKALFSSKTDNLKAALIEATKPKEKSIWTRISSIFFSAPEAKIAEQHNYKSFEKPAEASLQDLVSELNAIISKVELNNFAICDDVRENILKTFNAVNNKFSQDDINQKIEPAISLKIAQVQKNVLLAKELVQEFEAEIALQSKPQISPK